MGWVPRSVRDADTLAQTIIDNLQPGVVPIFTGHSMGGMLAHAMGAKYNYASVGFNPLGLGEGVRRFIDKGDRGRCKRANDVAYAECHPSFAMRGDWVSDERGSKVARLLVKKPYIGQ
ncbi:MAG: lysophospholipase [Puniceicoccales bacterium]|jgi:pimeloyl-ACP methyl ester carboxylesterase|nr:lysophospholipase [Puniceicoccales bacterium]